VLEPDFVVTGDGVNVVKTPDAEDLEARLLDVVYSQVDIGVTNATDRAPVAVGTSKVLSHPINIKSHAAYTRVGPRRQVASAGGKEVASNAGNASNTSNTSNASGS
jgi:hypothetical protein